MKTIPAIHSILLATVLACSAAIGLGQNAAPPACPLGHEPGYGRSLTPEQRMAQRAVVQQLVNELRAKREAGTLTAEEAAWLEAVETRGGPCLNGGQRGPRPGRGPMSGAGAGNRRGLRDGTGPRCMGGQCPQSSDATPGTGR